MPNSLKIITRSLLIVLFMFCGAWLIPYVNTLNAFSDSSGILAFAPSIVMFIILFLIGTVLGSMVKPRFTKNSNKIIYILPTLIFAIIGLTPLLYYFFPLLPLHWLGYNLSQFSFLSWTLTGLFTCLAYR